jgi:hypothetical protein
MLKFDRFHKKLSNYTILPQMKTNQKELLQIAFFCFITDSFFRILFVLYGIFLSTIIGFQDYKISLKGELSGCVPNNWMKVTVTFSMLFYILFLTYLSYFLVKKGKETSNRLVIVIGSLFLYPIINSVGKSIYYKIRDPFFIVKNEVNLEKIKLALFGDLYNLWIYHFIESLFYLSIAVFGIWYLWNKIWDKDLRVKFLRVGILSIIAGRFFFIYLGKFYLAFIK